MNSLELKVPPPIVAVLFGLVMWASARVAPAFVVDGRLRFAIAGVFGLLGVVTAALGILAFRRARTTVNPVQPEKASLIVSGGVYGFTRNPMYVGLTLGLLSWAAYLAAPWTLPGPIVFVLYITRFQILPEERVLTAKFGREYAEYKDRVRRWV
jgi:protein-S-isoprenylcysteine O-methyltransferase Ste14